MKTLLLMRHAKSSWKKKRLRDHERPLSKRGRRDAPRMGTLLAELDLTPDYVISSTAKRARKTAKKVATAAGCEVAPLLVDELYPGDDDALWHALTQIPDECSRALVVGHDPALAEFLTTLTGEIERLPTGSIARIALDISHWSDLGPGSSGHLEGVWKPKELAKPA